MQYKQKTYTAEEAAKMADEVGDFDASPKHLKREILALKKRVAELEASELWRRTFCDVELSVVEYGEGASCNSE